MYRLGVCFYNPSMMSLVFLSSYIRTALIDSKMDHIYRVTIA